jgi:hypothetical protein
LSPHVFNAIVFSRSVLPMADPVDVTMTSMTEQQNADTGFPPRLWLSAASAWASRRVQFQWVQCADAQERRHGEYAASADRRSRGGCCFVTDKR